MMRVTRAIARAKVRSEEGTKVVSRVASIGHVSNCLALNLKEEEVSELWETVNLQRQERFH